MAAAEASRFSLEYTALVGLINSRLSTGPLDIQILPDASFLLGPGLGEIVENTLGVPKAVLAKAFLAARRIFFEHLDNLAENAELILDSTSLILLFDPEHITAANARKKVCLAYRSRSAPEQTNRLRDELWFTQILLTSKLKRHNKSPTLWAHRKWLMKNFSTVKGVLGPKWVEFEIEEVILISAEHHPKNYYAWDYMRWWTRSRPGLVYQWRPPVNGPLVMLMRDWCMHHTSDSSGWSFLTSMMKAPELYSIEGQQLQIVVARKVLDAAVKLNLKNLSLWKFLQEMLGFMRTTFLGELRSAYLLRLGKMRADEPRGSALQVFAQNSLLAIGADEDRPDYD
ncbi:hypothetical protein VE03_04672 [Pseudogymnoascus sp. 23342-1-I1]|nr:hypothetical protein VE03_04672 [Pseudogymnoascus sp. 23342-1-I1]